MTIQADLTGHGLARALIPADLAAFGEIYEVRPPTVREAIEISAICAAVAAGTDHVRTLATRARTWLPPALVDALLTLEVAEFARITSDLVRLHAEKAVARTKDAKTETAGAAKRRGRDSDFRLVLSDYCQVYGGDPWTVYDTTPWPFFLALIAVQSHATARDLLRLAEVEILPHTGKKAKEGVESLQRRAEGPLPPAQAEDPNAEPETAPLDVVLAGRERLRRAIATGRW
jgi:hypothetical protein